MIIDLNEAYHTLIQSMQQEVVAHKESLIQALVAEETGSPIVSPQEILTRGQIKVYPDGIEEFIWDNLPRIRFYQVKLVDVDGRSRMVQPFEQIPVPEEEPQDDQ